MFCFYKNDSSDNCLENYSSENSDSSDLNDVSNIFLFKPICLIYILKCSKHQLIAFFFSLSCGLGYTFTSQKFRVNDNYDDYAKRV